MNQGGGTPYPAYPGNAPPQPQGYPGQGPPQGYPGQTPPQTYPPQGPPPGYQGQAPPQPYPGQGPPAVGFPGQGPPPAGAVPPGPPGGAVPTGPPGGTTPPGPAGAAGGGEGPELPDNPNYKEAEATAPPVEKMDTITGYEGMTFDGALAPPPSYQEATQEEPPERRPIAHLPVITEDQAREALLTLVAENCCYGKGAAQRMAIKDLQSTSAFHYTLESFTESRNTSWAFEPYMGQPVDGPMNGVAPMPWSIVVHPPEKFKDTVAHTEVPHTASVKPCHTCLGMGRVVCGHCCGRGRNRCSSCHGSGQTTHYINNRHEHRCCSFCHGSGRRRCTWCHGNGQVTCKTCQGRCQLKCFIRLTITWKNHFEDHIVERTALPDQLIRKVSGQTAYEDEQPMVWPVTHFPDQTINQVSNQLVHKHRTAFPAARILAQRQRVRIVPVTEVTSQFKAKDFQFFVYGFEKKVHAPDYPETCCCGCTIL